MAEDLPTRFASVVRQLPLAAFRAGPFPPELLIDEARDLAVYYAPFDHVNEKARIVLVGITPGGQQMRNALLEFRRLLDAGNSVPEALAGAKRFASFSGPMRKNLCDMLDYFGVQRLLGIGSCMSLFHEHSDLVHFTSLLRYPVLRNGCNYSGAPDILKSTFLHAFLLQFFAVEAARLRNALFVPLGPQVSAVMQDLVGRGVLDSSNLLDGLEHPSGANTERIAYLMERKPREKLSTKTNADRIDKSRASLRAKISVLATISAL